MHQRYQEAAPPDDGGHTGADTLPYQTLLTRPEDTEAIESIGPTALKDGGHENRGLMIFWGVVVGLALMIVLFAYVRGLVA